MEKAAPARPLYRQTWFLAVAAAALVAIIVVIAVPLAVLLPKRHGKAGTAILLPLYIYPNTSTAWDPLYSALSANPNVKFMVIINPSSGPGSSQSPDKQYSAELEKLSTYSNAVPVGYVRTGYGTRNLSDVLAEASVYAGWASKNSSFAMHGIFFDESPHEFAADAVGFMRTATKAVKDNAGFAGQRTVIRNPGVVPDSRYNDTNTDISVVFEEAYDKYQALAGSLAALTDGREHHCIMMHSVPVMAKDKLGDFVKELSKQAQFLFVTNSAENYYESFGSDWGDFAGVVPS